MAKTCTLCCLLLTAMLISTACASKKFTTTIAQPEHLAQPPAVRFTITSVTPLSPDDFFITGYTSSDYWSGAVRNAGHIDNFLSELNDVAGSMYPEVFVRDGDGLPLAVHITASNQKHTSVSSGFLAAVTWGVFGLILPLPLKFECDFDVAVTCPASGKRGSVMVSNRLNAWISFPSPLALLPVPGRAGRRAYGIYPYQSRYYSGRTFTLESFVAAIVVSLQEAQCLAAD